MHFEPTLPIKTERLCLRAFTRGDVDAVFAYRGREDVALRGVEAIVGDGGQVGLAQRVGCRPGCHALRRRAPGQVPGGGGMVAAHRLQPAG